MESSHPLLFSRPHSILLWGLGFWALASLAKASPPTPQESIPWFKGGFAEALSQAQEKKKLLLLDMYAEWCYPCKRYEREVFPKPEVQALFRQNFILVKRDGFRDEGRILAKRYNCVTYPCILVIDQKGEEIDRITRFFEARSFAEQIRSIIEGKGTLADLLVQLQKNPQDGTLRYRVGFRLAYRGDARAVEHLLHVAKHPPKEHPHLAAKALYVLGRIYYRNTLRDCVKASAIFSRYEREFPQGTDLPRVKSLHQGCLKRLRR